MQILKKHIKVFMLLFASVFCCNGLSAQNNKANTIRERDSLINLINKNPEDPKSGKWYYELSNRYLTLGQYAKVLESAQKAITASKMAKDTNTTLNSYLMLGHVDILDDQPVKAIECYLSARKLLEKMNQPKRDAEIVTQIGLVYFNRGHYQKAAESFQEALSKQEKLSNEDGIIANTKYLAICNYMLGKYDESIVGYELLLKKYRERDDWENTKMVYQRLNEIYQKQEDYDKVFKCNYDLYNLCTAHDNIKESLNALNNVAYCYVCIRKYDKAIKYYTQLLESDKKFSNDEKIDAGTYTSLGLCYQNMDNLDKSIENLQKAVAIRQKYNQNFEAATIDNIMALIYLKEEDLHNAEYHVERAVIEAEKASDNGYDDDGELRKAVYITYNKVLSAKGEDKKATDYYKKYLSLRDSSQMAKEMRERRMAEELRKLADAEEKYQKGLDKEEFTELNAANLQLIAENRQREIELLTKNNEIQEMEKKRIEQSLILARQQQEALKKENEIRALQLEREKAETRLKLQDAAEKDHQREIKLLEEQRKNQALTIENQQKAAKQMRLIVYMAFAMILFFIVVFIMMRKKNKKLKEQQKEIEQKNAVLVTKNDEIMSINNELSRQKEIIEKANQSITDSIVYAKRIQTAVCPSPTFLSTFNFEYFLVFRPRDIVSGDYYWFYSDNKDFVYIVAADCTGHGVPGAFMSMLGVSLFNKIVAERNVHEPADILTELRKEIKIALHQESMNSAQKDGMDLSLVKYNLKDNSLTFSGANNNGYLIQRFSHEEEDLAKSDLAKPEFLRENLGSYTKLTVMPADPMPIGVYIREKERFSQKEYKLRKGDSFYLTSDGYIDQFGGEHGRKFLTKNFEKMLLDINGYSMDRQEEIVIATHEKWIGTNYTQLDDIIVIGIRV